MKNLNIVKITYRSNPVRNMRYKIVPEGKSPKFTSTVTSMHFRAVPKLVAKHINVNRGLSKKNYELIWKLSYPNQLLDNFIYVLKSTEAVKHNFAELYKRLTTKNYTLPKYSWMSTASGELLEDWKEVLKDMWWNLKSGYIPPIYVYNPDNFN